MAGKIMLTAQGFYSSTVKDLFFELAGNTADKKVAIITTAARDKENNKFVLRDLNTLTEMGFETIDCIDLETQPTTDLSVYDVFFVAGGNTFKLLKFAKLAKFLKSIENLLARGGIYFGISAGSLILGPSIILANEVTPDSNDENLTDMSGLDLIPFTIYPHYEESIEKELVVFEQKHGINIQRLTNDQAILIEMIPMNLRIVS